MLLLRGRSRLCKEAITQAARQLSPTSNDDKRGHASIEASLEQALEFIDDELVNITPKQIHLRRKQREGGPKRAWRAA